jgi:hypothetical protein
MADEQLEQLAEHANTWIESALRTGAADRPGFEDAARRCYEYAEIPWHGRVVWVGSPHVLAFAGPVAALVLAARRGTVSDEEQITARVTDSLREAVRDRVLDAAVRAMDERTHGALARQVDRPRQSLFAIYEAVAEALQSEAGLLGKDGMGSTVREAVDSATGGAQQAEVLSWMWRAVSRKLLPGGYFSSNPSAWSPPITSALREVVKLELADDLWGRSHAFELATRSAYAWYPCRDFVMVCEWPVEIHTEPARPLFSGGPLTYQLHRTDGPAMAWPDGWALHGVHGRRVAGWIIDHPERITVRNIESEGNAELRRLMIERYGWPRYISDCGAKVVDQVPMDHKIPGLRGARLLRKVLPGEPEPIVYLEMLNSTPEPDGTYRRYLERIDPKAYDGSAGTSCHAALASRWHYRDENGELRRTFSDWRDYCPTAES